MMPSKPPVDSTDQILWKTIRETANQIGWKAYIHFVDDVLPPLDVAKRKIVGRKIEASEAHRIGTDEYFILKAATEAFVLNNCLGKEATLQSLSAFQRLPDAARFDAPSPAFLPALLAIQENIRSQSVADLRPQACLLEMIWCYWQEVGMLTATMDKLVERVAAGIVSPIADAHAAASSSVALQVRGIVSAYLRDANNLLSPTRRAYEYQHQYGLHAQTSVSPARTQDDPRSRFPQAFSRLLATTGKYYWEDYTPTVVADPMLILQSLREVHSLLRESIENQCREIPRIARQEMLLIQWILSQRALCQLLPIHTGISYPEEWMASVDAMKRLQGWTDLSILHFHRLAVAGEQILLSIRFGRWNGNATSTDAGNWAHYWREEIQGYIEAYRFVTGVDLSEG
jgi:hypothetical protein